MKFKTLSFTLFLPTALLMSSEFTKKQEDYNAVILYKLDKLLK